MFKANTSRAGPSFEQRGSVATTLCPRQAECFWRNGGGIPSTKGLDFFKVNFSRSQSGRKFVLDSSIQQLHESPSAGRVGSSGCLETDHVWKCSMIASLNPAFLSQRTQQLQHAPANSVSSACFDVLDNLDIQSVQDMMQIKGYSPWDGQNI